MMVAKAPETDLIASSVAVKLFNAFECAPDQMSGGERTARRQRPEVSLSVAAV